MNSDSKRTFELTFYNVAEMATEARRCKQLEKEAILVGHQTHTQNELDAAVALLMLRYQPTTQLQSQYTPTDSPIVAPKPLIAENGPRKHKYYPSTFDRKDLEPYRLKSYAKYKPNIGRSATSSFKSSRDNSSSRTSLLTSCRNILKEFLSHNSAP